MKHFTSLLFVIAAIAAFLVSTSAQSLNADEKSIIDYIDKHDQNAVSLLETTVNIESPTEDLAGVRSVGAVFKKEFEAIGMTARWIEMPPEMKRA